MTTGQVVLVGADSLQAELRAASAHFADLRQVHGQAGRMVASAQAGSAPRDTGALAGSVRASATPTAAVIQAGAVYAAPIHWGWRARGIRAQPWLSHAAQRTEPQWLRYYMADINRTLDKVEGAPA